MRDKMHNWTEGEIKYLVRHYRKDMKITEISKELNISRWLVHGQIKKMGLAKGIMPLAEQNKHMARWQKELE